MTPTQRETSELRKWLRMKKSPASCRNRKYSRSASHMTLMARGHDVNSMTWLTPTTGELSERDQFSGRDWTQRAFHLLLRSVLQTIRPLSPPQHYHNSQSETLQRNWTQPSRPRDKARRASERDSPFLAHPPVSLIQSPTLTYMASWRSLRSSRPPRGKAPNQDAPNPKRRRRTVSSSDVTVRDTGPGRTGNNPSPPPYPLTPPTLLNLVPRGLSPDTCIVI